MKLYPHLSYLVVFSIAVAYAQVDPQQPFVKVSTQPINIDGTTRKVFQTTLSVVFVASNNSSDLNQTVLIEAANNLYSTSLDGFISPIQISSVSNVTSNPNRSVLVTYTTEYYYTLLNTSVNGSNTAILETIGNVTFLRAGFENNSNFSSLYNVDSTEFSFEGFNVCPTANGTCNPGAYVECAEVSNGVSITCQSVCYNSFCLNGGYCHHDNANTQPICSCHNFADSWYLGAHCETLAEVWMLAVFFVIVFLILVALIPIMTCICIKQIPRRLAKENESAKKKLEKMKRGNKLNNGNPPKKTHPELNPASPNKVANDNTSAIAQPSPTPAPRKYVTSPTEGSQRRGSRSSLESSFQHSETSVSSSESPESHPQLNEERVAEESNHEAPDNRDLYQSISPTYSYANVVSSTSSSETSSHRSSSGNEREMDVQKPHIAYVEPPTYSVVKKPKAVNIYVSEEPLVSTV